MVYRNTGKARRLAETAPGLHTDALSWQLFALCRGEDLSLFFHPDGERGAARRQRQELAKRLCEQCVVISQCRDYSLASEEPFGTWGGLTEDERSRLLPDTAVNIRTHRARPARSSR